LALVVYLKLRIVRITLTSNAPEVLEVLDVVVGGGVSALPSVGMFPAKIGIDSAQMNASAIAIFFMDLAPFEVEKMPRFLHKRERKRMEQ
jgi:hypothetical protein